ncbi:protein-glutamate O-methyltransferase CheR [Rickettsiales bacterium]|nr:protein-glutamate O-methyltransferase CheR [Rickettsiales bacterium]
MGVPDGNEFHFSDNDFKFVAKLINEHTGIVIADHKRNMVYSRLARRLRELKFRTFKEYCNLLEGNNGGNELVNFVNALTTNLTGFFREGHHFDHLEEHLRMVAKNLSGDRKIRIWSSASSSGQEPYSIAMTAHKALPKIASLDLKILATDIDTNMINKCKEGIYPKLELEKIPAEYKGKYISDIGNEQIQMSDKLKKIITFKNLNLLGPWPMKGMFDVIFCRNVIIYFDKPTQKALFERMYEILKPGGILYLGHSESLFGVNDKFELKGRTIYQRI